MMKRTIQAEELLLFLLSLYGLYLLNAEWWFYVLLLLGPDVSMIAYLAGNKAGAIVYNIFHHRGLAVLIFLIGFITQFWIVQVIGIILFGHSSMDRLFGYGLKYFSGFKDTHLGKIGSHKN